MKLQDQRIVLTGGAGGIGSCIAKTLIQAGAQVLLVDRNTRALEEICTATVARGGRAHSVSADLTQAEGRANVVRAATQLMGGVDILINNAGLLHFGPLEDEGSVEVERLLTLNLIAPIALTQAFLPTLLKQGHGHILNMGSIFGSLGFPYFSSYSASKAGLRGFSEALRRELDGTGVGVSYIAPRAVRTALNSDAVCRMNDALRVAMDPPERVAAAVLRTLTREQAEVFIGWPERLFVRLNALAPRLVDRALRKQKTAMREFVPAPR